MYFRVPLLFPVYAVVERLDTAATRAIDPPGTSTAGYDDILGAPVPYDTAFGRLETQQYAPPINAPCQVEEKTWEEMRQIYTGDAEYTNIVAVFHRESLETLGLLDATTREILFKKDDKVSRFENATGTVLPFNTPFYIVKICPRSWGMGPDGYDLHVAVLANRPSSPL